MLPLGLFDELYTFDSNINLSKYPVQGIAIVGKRNMEEKMVFCDLIEELHNPKVNLEGYCKLELIEDVDNLTEDELSDSGESNAHK